jgi:hypothetical protein
MKKLVLIKVVILVMVIAIVTLTSCSGTRMAGCPDTHGLVGYK